MASDYVLRKFYALVSTPSTPKKMKTALNSMRNSRQKPDLLRSRLPKNAVSASVMTSQPTVITAEKMPNTPLATLASRGKYSVPAVPDLLRELRTMIDEARPTNATFRTNHASNYLPLAGRLPKDRERLVHLLDEAIAGRMALRPERTRGL